MYHYSLSNCISSTCPTCSLSEHVFNQNSVLSSFSCPLALSQDTMFASEAHGIHKSSNILIERKLSIYEKALKANPRNEVCGSLCSDSYTRSCAYIDWSVPHPIPDVCFAILYLMSELMSHAPTLTRRRNFCPIIWSSAVAPWTW